MRCSFESSSTNTSFEPLGTKTTLVRKLLPAIWTVGIPFVVVFVDAPGGLVATTDATTIIPTTGSSSVPPTSQTKKNWNREVSALPSTTKTVVLPSADCFRRGFCGLRLPCSVRSSTPGIDTFLHIFHSQKAVDEVRGVITS